MNLFQAFKMATKSIGNNKGRSFLTMLGIIIGIMAVIILVSVVQGQQDMVLEQFERMGTNKISAYYYQWNGQVPDYTEELYAYCQELGSDLVLGVSPQKYAWSDGIRYKDKQSYGNIYLGSDQYTVCAGFTLAAGRDLSYMDVQRLNRVCLIGSQVAQDLFNYENPVGKNITISGDEYTVVGVYASKNVSNDYGGSWNDNLVVVPYTLETRLNKNPYGNTNYEFLIKAASSDATQTVINKLNDWFLMRIDQNNGYYYVYTENNWQENQTEGFAEQGLLMGGIAGISLLVGGIGIMNIMLVTVTERTREIGIRKAIGAPRRSLISQFLIEASMISAIGGIIGILLGCGGTVIAGKLILDRILAPPPYIMLVAFVVSVLFGIIFGVYPAVRASRLQPVEALRNE